MNAAKDLRIDLFLAGIKAQSQERIFRSLALETASLCGVEPLVLQDYFMRRLDERMFGIGDGVAIFDIKLSIIKRPIIVVSTFEQPVAFNAPDNRDIDLMVSVISPPSCGPVHLQRVSAMSRVLKCRDLCDALRDARDADAMHVLFMPEQEWIVAA